MKSKKFAAILAVALSLWMIFFPLPKVLALPVPSAQEPQKVEDPAALISHAPVLKSVGLKKQPDNKFYLYFLVGQAHEEVRFLNTLSDGGVMIEVWLRTGNKGWVKCYKGGFAEAAFLTADAEAYLGEIDSSAPVSYDIAFIYSFDNASYPPAEKTGLIQSPLSNIITKNTALYSRVTDWAEPELEAAEKYGLIPASLRGEDMTKSITREEFAELAVCLYEIASGTTAAAASPNPFTDSANPEVLKAKKLGITEGTSASTFSPDEAVNREQAAAMLGRTARLVAPNAGFSTDDAPVFSDRSQISQWALEHVLFMGKIGVIKGNNGKFMPRAVTDAQKKSGYAAATREEAVSMGVRLYEWYVNETKKNSNVPASIGDANELDR